MTVRRWAALGAALLGLAALITLAAWRLQRSRTTQLFGELVTRVETPDSIVALTFDDGPSVATDSVLDILRAEGVPATFFVVGNAVARRPDLARRIVAEGHELANHSYTHDRMVLMSPARVRREVEATDSVIRAAGHRGEIYFRPPYGSRLLALPWYLMREGRPTVLWSQEPDSYSRTPEGIVQHVAERVQPGDIILLHVELASRTAERDALPAVIRALRQHGYTFVTLSDLMHRPDKPRP